MATTYFTGFAQLGFSSNAGQLVAAPKVPPSWSTSLTISTSSTTTSRIPTGIFFVEVNTDAAVCLAVDGPATTSTWRLGANETRYYSTTSGSFWATISTS